MSLTTELNNAVRNAWVGLNDEMIDRSYATPKILLRRARKDIALGNNIDFDVWFERVPTGAYGPYETLQTARRESTTRGTVPFRHYYGALNIDGPSLRANNGVNIGQIMNVNSLKELPSKDTALQLFSIVNEQMKRALNDISILLGAHFWSDGSANDGKAILGTTAIIKNSTASYAGLDPTATAFTDTPDAVTGNGWWTPQVLANAGTNRALTLELLLRMATYTRRGNEKDEEILVPMDNNLWEELQMLLEAQKTYDSPELHDIGVEAVKYHFCTFVRDELHPANEMNWLNLAHLWFQIRPSADFIFNGFNVSPAQDAVAGFVFADLQLVCDDRHRQGLLDDISGIND